MKFKEVFLKERSIPFPDEQPEHCGYVTSYINARKYGNVHKARQIYKKLEKEFGKGKVDEYLMLYGDPDMPGNHSVVLDKWAKRYDTFVRINKLERELFPDEQPEHCGDVISYINARKYGNVHKARQIYKKLEKEFGKGKVDEYLMLYGDPDMPGNYSVVLDKWAKRYDTFARINKLEREL